MLFIVSSVMSSVKTLIFIKSRNLIKIIELIKRANKNILYWKVIIIIAKYSIQAQGENATKTVVETTGGLKITIDEPERLGGGGEGPNPVEYLLASLAGCLNIVGHLVADEMDFELDDLKINIKGKLDPAKFKGKSEKNRAGYQEINVKIDAKTDAEQETLNKWLNIVKERCPVSDNIANQTPVKIEMD